MFDNAKEFSLNHAKNQPKRRRQSRFGDFAAFLVESSHDAIVVSNLDGDIEIWNPAAERMYGFTAQEIVGKPLETIVPSQYYDQMQHLKEKLLQGELITQFETERLCKDGSLISVRLTISSIKNTEGKIVGFSTISHDLREEKNLYNWFSLLSHVIDDAPDSIRILDPEGTIIYANKAFEKMYGFTDKEYIGKDVHDLYADSSIISSIILPTLQTTGRWEGEILAKHVDGNTFPIWLTSSSITDSQGKLIAFVGIIRDITEKRKMEDLKKEFLSVVSHELKTPITTLKLLAQMYIQRFTYSSDVSVRLSDFQMINHELDRLIRLINDILDDSRLETGKLTLHFTEVQMKVLITRVVDKMRVLNPSHQIVVSNVHDVTVIADEERIEQVLVNLMSNAAKYSPPNTIIRISMEEKVKKIWIHVTDQGVGIPKNKQKRIFDRFYQVKSHKSGFGLGLYISNQIIIRHKGEIQVKSVQNKGSTFSFSLPIAQTD